MHGEALVGQQFTQRRVATCFPIRIIATGFADQVAHLAARRRRGVPHHVRDFVREPEGNQLGVESQPLCVGVGDAGEVLKTHEGDAAAVDHEFARVGRTHADHQHDIERDVGLEQLLHATLGLLG